MRIGEFIQVNPDIYVVGLREGSMLRAEGISLKLLGPRPARIFRKGMPPRELTTEGDFSFLM